MKKVIIYSLIGIMAVSVLSLGVVYAAEPGLAEQKAAQIKRMLSRPRRCCQEFVLRNMATILDMDVDELKEKVKDGKTFFEVAEEIGLSKEELFERVRNQVSIYLDAFVKAGVMEQEKADEILKKIEERQLTCIEEPDCERVIGLRFFRRQCCFCGPWHIDKLELKSFLPELLPGAIE